MYTGSYPSTKRGMWVGSCWDEGCAWARVCMCARARVCMYVCALCARAGVCAPWCCGLLSHQPPTPPERVPQQSSPPLLAGQRLGLAARKHGEGQLHLNVAMHGDGQDDSHKVLNLNDVVGRVPRGPCAVHKVCPHLGEGRVLHGCALGGLVGEQAFRPLFLTFHGQFFAAQALHARLHHADGHPTARSAAAVFEYDFDFHGVAHLEITVVQVGR
mmetsp:Transcript_21458/g.54085  ORF Transcript_21458/g.54085 Transcript_21458/m.54085 type:complete len:215 (-) Transcript_21458:399-1043(-)